MTQRLHLVFGGELIDPSKNAFKDVDAIDIVGMYPNYEAALKAWRGASQRHVDEARTKYVIVHLHRLMDPEQSESEPKA